MAKLKVRIITHQGRIVSGVGAGEFGDILEIEEDIARSLVIAEPNAYELVADAPDAYPEYFAPTKKEAGK